jgi:hypothetical protein
MAITKNSNGQTLIVRHVDINFSNVASGVAAEAIDIPANAVIVSGELYTTTAWNSATSDVLDVGDATMANRYLNDGNIHAIARVALVPTGYTTNGDPLKVTWVGVGAAPTAGVVRLMVAYYVIGRAGHTFG